MYKNIKKLKDCVPLQSITHPSECWKSYQRTDPCVLPERRLQQLLGGAWRWVEGSKSLHSAQRSPALELDASIPHLDIRIHCSASV